MNWVSPIKNQESLKRFLKELRAVDEKYYILFQIGAGTGSLLRDLLVLKVEDLKGKDFLQVTIGARKMRRCFVFPEKLKEEIRSFTENRDPKEPLFLGRRNSKTPLSREQVYRIFKRAGKKAGLPVIGAQTMRKTFAWNYYRNTGDIVYVQKLLNHASAFVTYEYIGESPMLPEISRKLAEDEEKREEKEEFLAKYDSGRQRIEKLKRFLGRMEKQLDDPEKSASYFANAERMISGMEGLAEEFKKSQKKLKTKT